jgi:hypothetical protein
MSLFPLSHVCGNGLFYCFVIVFFCQKNRFDKMKILKRQIMAVLREARSPLVLKNDKAACHT